MSAAALEAALHAVGIDCAVEAREALAILVPRDDTCDLSRVERRELALRLGREHGFTHVAIELTPTSGA